MCSGRLHALGAAVVITTCYNEAAGGDLPWPVTNGQTWIEAPQTMIEQRTIENNKHNEVTIISTQY